MMSERRPDGKITLEDLLRLKRSERPPAEFWTQFERELRTRQLAAAVEKKRWWFGLPGAFAGLARYQMPLGAAAVLAVTVLTLREYREPGLEPRERIPAAQAPVASADLGADEVLDDAVELAVVHVAPAPAQPPRSGPAPVESAGGRALTSMVPWSANLPAETVERELSPSARSIAANLAAAEQELTRVLGRRPALQVDATVAREPLAQLTSLRDQRRERLFAYDAQPASYSAEREEARAPERVASRLSEAELYESVRRLSGGGDRLTVRF